MIKTIIIYFLCITVFFLFSCSDSKKDNLSEIKENTNQAARLNPYKGFDEKTTDTKRDIPQPFDKVEKTTVYGELWYPSEGVPSMEIKAINVLTGQIVSGTQNMDMYEIKVEPGSYYFYSTFGNTNKIVLSHTDDEGLKVISITDETELLIHLNNLVHIDLDILEALHGNWIATSENTDIVEMNFLRFKGELEQFSSIDYELNGPRIIARLSDNSIGIYRIHSLYQNRDESKITIATSEYLKDHNIFIDEIPNQILSITFNDQTYKFMRATQ